MSATIRAEVAVLGGGPAGAVAALALARLGRGVVLCERARFPRSHIGICLSPDVGRLLAFLGLADPLDNPAHRSAAAEQRWATAAFEPGPAVTIADRAAFDSDLLASARSAGVQVLQLAHVETTARSAGGWRLEVRSDAGRHVVSARLLIDATGRGTGSRRRQRYGAATLAVWGHWRGSLPPLMRVSAECSAWLWAAQLADGQTVAICFVDPSAFRRSGRSLRETYIGVVAESGILAHASDLSLADGPWACDATPYAAVEETAGLLRIGDADMALDPLSSSGVQTAIQSGMAAAPILNTLLTPGADAPAAMEFWRARRAARIARHRDWAGQLYAEAFARHQTAFWSARARAPETRMPAGAANPMPDPDQIIVLSSTARLAPAPCVRGALVERLECVHHGRLPEPVAFVGGVHVAPMLQRLSGRITARNAVLVWSRSIGPSMAHRLLAWAWHHDIVVPA